MTTRKLKNHEYAQARIEIENDGNGFVYRLVSYSTHVATVHCTNDGCWFLDCNGLYSMTTRRHISWFLDDINSPFTYQDAKRSVEIGRIVKGYAPGAKCQLVDKGVIYEPADFQSVMDFAAFLGLSSFVVIDAATGEVVYEQ